MQIYGLLLTLRKNFFIFLVISVTQVTNHEKAESFLTPVQASADWEQKTGNRRLTTADAAPRREVRCASFKKTFTKQFSIPFAIQELSF